MTWSAKIVSIDMLLERAVSIMIYYDYGVAKYIWIWIWTLKLSNVVLLVDGGWV